MLRHLVLSVLCLALAAGCTSPQSDSHGDLSGVAHLDVSADSLGQTVVTPHTDQPLGTGHNVLWCSTFQLAWNELCAALGRDPHWEGEPPMVDILNRKDATKEDIDEACYVALGGAVGDGIVDDILNALAEKFQGQAAPELVPTGEGMPADALVAYAYLSQDLPFEVPFSRLDEPIRFADQYVANFGLLHLDLSDPDARSQARQVSILDYRDWDDFIIELKTTRADERLILAMTRPSSTLQETIDRVRRRVARADPMLLEDGDSLAIPVLDFDILREYSELSAGDSPIVIAKQKIRFRLNQRGAMLLSEAVIVGGYGGGPGEFIFDRPFLVLLQRKGAQNPYFALWVENAELLVPQEPPSAPDWEDEFDKYDEFGELKEDDEF